MRIRGIMTRSSSSLSLRSKSTLKFGAKRIHAIVILSTLILIFDVNVLVAAAATGDSLTQRDVDSVRNKFEQDRNVTVGTHIDVVPSTATAPLDSSRQPSTTGLPSGRPNRFDPLPVLTTGSGNALPPNRLEQQSRESYRDYYVEGQCLHPTSYGQCMGFMTCCLMHRIPPPCNVLKPCGVMIHTMSCVDMPPMKHLFPSPGHVTFPEDNRIQPALYRPQSYSGNNLGNAPPRILDEPEIYPPRPMPQPRPVPKPHPEPNPEPWPRPRPEPYPRPIPEPYPRPVPEPYPRPIPEPYPRPIPEPYPRPIPEPYPRPIPEPYPRPIPEPYPRPRPEPYPRPVPEPYPRPIPEPYPRPVPRPIPEPYPHPIPEPYPHPMPEPYPRPIPEPYPRPVPEPNPHSLPEPIPEPQPDQVLIPDPKVGVPAPYLPPFQCPAQHGLFPDSRDCRRYWECVGYQSRLKYCDGGQLFDRNHLCCLPAHMVSLC